jgi:hypothetical protein
VTSKARKLWPHVEGSRATRASRCSTASCSSTRLEARGCLYGARYRVGVPRLPAHGERRGALIIEAKRSGLLEPATKGDEVMHVALTGPVVKPLRPGIEQAMRYAMENGVPVAAGTDGKTWLFFKASRTDGQPPMNGKGVLFPNPTAVMNNYAKFAELLNVSAIVDRKNLAHLQSRGCPDGSEGAGSSVSLRRQGK